MTDSRTSVLRSRQAGLSCLSDRGDGSSDRAYPGSRSTDVADLVGGAFPPRLPHQRRSTLTSGSTREPQLVHGSLGDALIHRLSLVAGPVGSEWRTRRPCQSDTSNQGE